MTKQSIARAALFTVLILLATVLPSSAESVPLSLFGSLTATAFTGTGRGDAGLNGFENELRLVLEGSPETGISFRAEGGYSTAYGLASQKALVFDAGLAPTPDPASLPPDTDLHRTFFLDQAWASAALGRLKFQAGIIPVGWGASYLYNPTSRTAAPSFPGENIDVLSGKPGLSATAALPMGLSVEAYALASPRAASPVGDLQELENDTFPFGAKIQLRSDLLDVSFSVLRELPAFGEKALQWIGADLAGIAGPFSLYAEAAAPTGALPAGENLFTRSEASAGLSATVPVVETIVRLEYIRLGGGSTEKNRYDNTAFFSGEKILLATNYLFAGLEKEDAEAARWKVTCGSLVNLDDLSAVLLAEAVWVPALALELSAFVRHFTGTALDEFGGGRPFAPGLSFTPYRGIAGISAKWNF